MENRIYNFSAGPATLPEEVLKASQEAIWNLNGSGIGVMEHSHRGKPFMAVIEEAEALCRELAGISDDYHVMFLQGGASQQFFMVPMNFLGAGQTADYLMTGAWSQKALVEAQKLGNAHVAASSEDETFTYIPPAAATQYSDKPAYVHFTSNNTIFGTQWAQEPASPEGSTTVCDASSDIFSRPLDMKRYGILYAGAQKNLGPSGVTLVVIRKDLVDAGSKNIPTILQYRTQASKGSMFNTPPTFGIFVIGQVFAWIKNNGGLSAMAERNEAKAKLIYDYLDGSSFFRGTARPDSRSRMNVCFRGPSEELEAKFIAEATKAEMSGLKGHRSVGGMRASIYNAFPLSGCERLVQFMADFEKANG